MQFNPNSLVRLQLCYLYSALQLFLKSDVVHLHGSEVHRCSATQRARIEYCVLAPGKKQCRGSEHVSEALFILQYLKHQIFDLREVQVSSHHSCQQAYIPCNLWCYSWISYKNNTAWKFQLFFLQLVSKTTKKVLPKIFGTVLQF